MGNALQNIGAFFLDIIETIVVALAIFVVIYLFFVQPHQVRGASMESNFHDGEYIMTDKVSYRFGEPKRGQVIIFKAPRNPELDFIKRVIGLPGERIKIQNGKVYLNGSLLNETYLDSTVTTLPGSFMREGQEVLVPQGQYLVFGDNRPHSSDSREWGYITKAEIIGRAFFRYWPPRKVGLIPTGKYE